MGIIRVTGDYTEVEAGDRLRLLNGLQSYIQSVQTRYTMLYPDDGFESSTNRVIDINSCPCQLSCEERTGPIYWTSTTLATAARRSSSSHNLQES